MSDEVNIKKENDGDANAKMRELVAIMERQYTLNMIDAVERSMRKDSLWRRGEPVKPGCTCSCSFMLVMLIGFTVAACVSWIFNHSVLWCILHSILGWVYVCYKALWYVVTNH